MIDGEGEEGCFARGRKGESFASREGAKARRKAGVGMFLWGEGKGESFALREGAKKTSSGLRPGFGEEGKSVAPSGRNFEGGPYPGLRRPPGASPGVKHGTALRGELGQSGGWLWPFWANLSGLVVG